MNSCAFEHLSFADVMRQHIQGDVADFMPASSAVNL